MKRCSTLYVLRELHIKATMSYSTHLLEGLKSKMLITNAGEDAEHQKLSYIAGGNKNW